MTTKRINNAIAHIGLHLVKLELQCYFIDEQGHQVGSNLDIPRLADVSLTDWIYCAQNEWAKVESAKRYLDYDTCFNAISGLPNADAAINYLDSLKNAPTGIVDTAKPYDHAAWVKINAERLERERKLMAEADAIDIASDNLAFCAIQFAHAKKKRFLNARSELCKAAQTYAELVAPMPPDSANIEFPLS